MTVQKAAGVLPIQGARALYPFWYALALLGSRIVLILLLGRLTGGREISDDSGFQVGFVGNPLAILLNQQTNPPVPLAFPPFVPVLMWIVGRPLCSILPAFYALRLTWSFLEALAAGVMFVILNGMRLRPAVLRALLVMLILAPMGWMTTAVMCQEEAISMLFMAGAIWFVLRGRLEMAALCCGTGVVAAKIYFLVPLLAIVLGPSLRPWKKSFTRAALAGAAVLLGYLPECTRMLAGHPSNLASFTPSVTNSISLWPLLAQWFGLNSAEARPLSGMAALCLAMLPLLWTKVRVGDAQGPKLVALMTAMLLGVLTGFYHVNPEYYLILVPGLLVALPRVRQAVVVQAALALTWAINLFYGVAMAGASGDAGAKSVFVKGYYQLISADPRVLQKITIGMFFVFSLCLLVVLSRSRAAEDQAPGQSR